METQLLIPIYTSMTQLLEDLGSIADHTYVIHCHQLLLFDRAELAQGGTNCQTSSSVGSEGSRPISSVHPAASSMVTLFSASLSYLALRKTDAWTFSLIGEHIDYALFGVFPSAIERDILLACAPRDSSGHPYGAVTAQNLDQRYPSLSFSPIRSAMVGSGLSENEADITDISEWHLGIDHKVLHWESYVKAGYYVRNLVPYPEHLDLI
jgi:Galactokinase galactose-binding signature